jgi:hypothetical protein
MGGVALKPSISAAACKGSRSDRYKIGSIFFNLKRDLSLD